MADSVCGVAFSIWLRPSGAIAERLADVIAQAAEKFQAPSFTPHVTLLGNAPKGGEITKSGRNQSVFVMFVVGGI